MRAPLAYLSIKTLKVRRRSSAALVCSIAFCIALSLVLMSVLNSYQQNYRKQLFKAYGTQHAVLFNVPSGGEQTLWENASLRCGRVRIYGTYTVPESITGEVVSLGTMDDTAADLSRIRLLAGRLPDMSDGIAVEKGVLARMKITPVIGTEIPLDLNLLSENRKLKGEPAQATFILTGILENYRANQLPEAEQRISGFVDLPAILLAADNPLADRQAFSTNHFYIYMNHTASPLESAKLLKDVANAEMVYLNSKVYNPDNGEIRTGSPGTDLMPPLLLVACILFAAFFLLANMILLTGNERMQQIIGLRFAGAGSGDGLKYTAIRGGILILLGIPLGILLALPLHVLTRRILLKFPVAPFDFVPDFSGAGFIILGAVILIFTLMLRPVWRQKDLTAMELSRSMVREDRIRHVNFKSKNGILLWAVKSAANSANKLVVVGISFMMIVFIVISGVYMIRLMKYANMPVTMYDYWVRHSAKLYYSALMIPERTDAGIRENQLFYLASSPDVKSIFGIKRLDVNIARLPGEPEQKYRDMDPLPSAGMDQIMQQDKVKYGYAQDAVLYRRTLLGVDNEMLSALSPFVVSGTIQPDRLRTGKEILLCSKNREAGTMAGERFILSQIIEGKMFELEVSVGAVVYIPEDRQDLLKLYRSAFIWHQSTFDTLPFPVQYSDVRIELKDPKQTEDIRGRIQEIVRLNAEEKNKVSVQSGIEENEIYRNTGKTARLFIVMIVLILGLYSLINLVYYFSVRIRERLPLFGVMRAIGMTRRQLMAMVQWEAACFTGVSSLAGIGMSLLVFLIFHEVPHKGVSVFSVIPYEYIVLLPLVLVGAAALAVLFPALQVFRRSEVEAIREL
ncbi:MAG TPA: hypothetical protein DD727_00160 [Clostridiales bacterium]|nr:hypothetical protein [Clostridiales bacterium]